MSRCKKHGPEISSLPRFIWTAGLDGCIRSVAPHGPQPLGCNRGDLLGRRWLRRVHPDDRKQVIGSIRSASGETLSLRLEFRARLFGGTYHRVRANGRARPGSAAASRWSGNCIGIDDEAGPKEPLGRSNRAWRAMLEASGDCINVLSPDGKLLSVNDSGLEALGTELDQIQGRHWPEIWPEDARGSIAAALLRAAQGQRSRMAEYRPTRSGKPKWWDIIVAPVPDGAGKVESILAICRDITDHVARAEELKWASEHDALTGLPNRRAFQIGLQANVLRAMRSGSSVGLLVIDVDHFKHVNDTLGHDAGDELLKAFAARLTGALRAGDYVARLGGDEFGILLDRIRGDDELLQASRSVLGRLDPPIWIGSSATNISISIGGAIFPQHASGPVELMKCADTALYALKAAGRGGVRLFEPALGAEALKTARQMSIARTMLSDLSVEAFYQPKVELCSGRVAGHEALLRWQDPAQGLQLPGTVAQSFSNYELARKIGDIMLGKIIADIKTRPECLGDGRVSLNASPAEFLRDDYAERFLAMLKKHDVAPERFELEVTEHFLIEQHAASVGRALNVLHEAGVSVALDDFGTGHSSLSHLRDLPVDVVKIDMSFIQQMCANEEIRAIVEAVIGLSQSLGIETVAEGIETEQQRQRLAELGCTYGQGFLFGSARRAGELRQVHGPTVFAA